MMNVLIPALLAALSFAPPELEFIELGPQIDPQLDDNAPIGLEFAPSIAKHEREPLEQTFTKALPLACENVPCTHDCSDDEATLGLELSGASRDYALRWVATDPRLDAPMVIESRCELCSLVELEDQFAAELSRLCSRLDALDASRGELELSSDPTGARVRIDGRAVGRTPWSGELSAGEHNVELRALGHRPQQRTLTIYGSSQEHIQLSANWLGNLNKSTVHGRRPTWPGWTSLGLGIAMSIAGTALISVHGQPWTRRCTGSDLDALGNCRYLLTTRPLGIGLAAAGAGAIASGVGLLVWAQRDQSQTCAGINISGRF